MAHSMWKAIGIYQFGMGHDKCTDVNEGPLLTVSQLKCSSSSFITTLLIPPAWKIPPLKPLIRWLRTILLSISSMSHIDVHSKMLKAQPTSAPVDRDWAYHLWHTKSVPDSAWLLFFFLVIGDFFRALFSLVRPILTLLRDCPGVVKVW